MRLRAATAAAAAAIALCSAARAADAWQKKGKEWYKASSYDGGTYVSSVLTSINGGEIPYGLYIDEEGNIQGTDALRDALLDKKTQLAGVVDELVGMARQVAELCDAARLTEARFKAFADNLDAEFVKIFEKFKELEVKDEDGSTIQTLKRPVVDTKGNRIAYTGERAKVDGKSVSYTGTGKDRALQVAEFSSAGTGSVPCRAADGGLAWANPQDLVDGRTLGASIQGSTGVPYFALKSWNAPDKGDASCEDALGDMLVGAKKASGHYVLTRYDDGVLHYTKIGSVAGGEGDAGKFLRTASGGGKAEWAMPVTSIVSGGGLAVETDEATGRVTLTADGELIAVESRATTDGVTALMAGRRVRFEAADDSCVKVDVSQGASTNEIVVKIGVYYK